MMEAKCRWLMLRRLGGWLNQNSEVDQGGEADAVRAMLSNK
jgi:hypothetical protein